MGGGGSGFRARRRRRRGCWRGRWPALGQQHKGVCVSYETGLLSDERGDKKDDQEAETYSCSNEGSPDVPFVDKVGGKPNEVLRLLHMGGMVSGGLQPLRMTRRTRRRSPP